MIVQNLSPEKIPLEGRHLIEASAGTGKTFNITRIYLRLLLESQLTVQDILVMTFTRAATSELRSRMSQALRQALKIWESQQPPDVFFKTMLQRIPREKAIPLLEKALSSMDESGVFTLHGFCSRVLIQSAFESGLPFEMEVIQDSSEIELEVISDWYRIQAKEFPKEFVRLQTFYETPELFHKSMASLLKPGLSVTTEVDDSLRHGGAKEARTKKEQRQKDLEKAECFLWIQSQIPFLRDKIQVTKNQRRIMDFDDLIHLLLQRLDSGDGTQLRNKIRASYKAGLIDEFQDTDLAQYRILNHIFPTRQPAPLFLIGDPKQAIYAFRGGDIHAYLTAKEETRNAWNLGTNWRSSSALIEGLNRLFQCHPDGKPFGPKIPFHPVNASPTADEMPLDDPQFSASIHLIHFPFQEEHRYRRSSSMKKTFLPVIANWCAVEIRRLVSEKVNLGPRRLRESDIAILVRNKTESEFIQDALKKHSIPSVFMSNRQKVLQSEEGLELWRALHGILFLENQKLFMEGLASTLFGQEPQTLAQIKHDETTWEVWRQNLVELRELWLNRGVLAMCLDMIQRYFVPDPSSHERSLTNVIHLAEILQKVEQSVQRPQDVLDWLTRHLVKEGSEMELELRLESDENLVHIYTQHGSKGLEFPVVFLPFGCSYSDPAKDGPRYKQLIRVHDKANAHWILGPSSSERNAFRLEGHAESIRLFYVAVTRAIKRCYIATAPLMGYHKSPLGLSLGLLETDEFKPVLSRLSASHTCIRSENDTQKVEPPSLPNTAKLPKIHPALMTRKLTDSWWIASFSSLTSQSRQGGLSLPDYDQITSGESTGEKDMGVLEEFRFAMKGGRETGNLLHGILENLDFPDPNWEEALVQPMARYPFQLTETESGALIEWMTQCLHTELEPGLSLSSIPLHQTLREIEFYFPMKRFRMKQLSMLLQKLRETSVDSFPSFQQLEGMMHGFIDLVFKVEDRYFIADYKSNHLGPNFNSYGTEQLCRDMQLHNYDLQFLLYSLGLHRFLQLRVPNYHPETHFGGVYYLYLRGMKPGSRTGIYFHPVGASILKSLEGIFEGAMT